MLNKAVKQNTTNDIKINAQCCQLREI